MNLAVSAECVDLISCHSRGWHIKMQKKEKLTFKHVYFLTFIFRFYIIGSCVICRAYLPSARTWIIKIFRSCIFGIANQLSFGKLSVLHMCSNISLHNIYIEIYFFYNYNNALGHYTFFVYMENMQEKLAFTFFLRPQKYFNEKSIVK